MKQPSKAFLVQSRYSFENEKALTARLHKKYGSLNSPARFVQFPDDFVYTETTHDDAPIINLQINDGKFYLNALGLNHQAMDMDNDKKYAIFSDTSGRLIWLDLNENSLSEISSKLV